MVKELIKKQIQQAAQVANEPVTVTPKLAGLESLLVRYRLPLRWEAWGGMALMVTTMAALVSSALLLHQPTTRNNCEGTFWPFASASFRMYCAQNAADKRNLEDLLWAIHLLNDLPKDHPLRLELDRRIENWATKVLDLAEITFQEGDLDRAINFAQQIPENTSAYPLVEGRVARWQEVWDQGDVVYRRSVAALKNEDWRKAFSISLSLMNVGNRYWSDVQFQKLNQRIITAQKDSSTLGKARELISRGGLENLKAAMELISQLGTDSDLLKSAGQLKNQLGQASIRIAHEAMARQDLATATAAAQLVPEGTASWPEAQDFITLANAESLTWGDSISGLEQAIRTAQGIGSNRPLYLKAQELIFAWQSDIAALKIVQQAQVKAQPGDVPSLQTAIGMIQQIPPGVSRYRFRMIQQQMATWQAQVLTIQDRPILDEAAKVAELGTVPALRQAITIAARIPEGHPLHQEARGQILGWQDRINILNPPVLPPPPDPQLNNPNVPNPNLNTPNSDPTAPPNGQKRWLAQGKELASQGTATSFAEAVMVVNQVPAESPLRPEAEQLMTQWSQSILALANQQAATDLNQAIAIAQKVPPVSSAYPEAQAQIKTWQSQL
jgi:hypothetical protein